MAPIQLSENYRIEKDQYSWILVFSETREKKNKKTSKLRPFVFEDRWFYPDIKQLLRKYVDLDTKQCNSIDEIIKKLEFISTKIDSLSNTIFKK
ncbi:hypothetical protein [Pseudotamlana agarivorans]|uniref:hypothetical protein n=1 Tax=Pseudotamlana agarivorans TaxID=481183 RepID=UPI00082B0E0F|nr:hypothetical protein [Tamlana agarivorans]